MRPKLCFFNNSIDSDIALLQQGRDRFTVRYGLQVKKDLSYADAACELGECLMHALACQGKLDNRQKGEQ